MTNKEFEVRLQKRLGNSSTLTKLAEMELSSVNHFYTTYAIVDTYEVASGNTSLYALFTITNNNGEISLHTVISPDNFASVTVRINDYVSEIVG